jgi:hypothetical protein
MTRRHGLSLAWEDTGMRPRARITIALLALLPAVHARAMTDAGKQTGRDGSSSASSRLQQLKQGRGLFRSGQRWVRRKNVGTDAEQAQLFGGLGGSALRSLLKWYVGPRYHKIESASDGVEHPPGAPKIESDKFAIATHGGLKYVLDTKNGKSLRQRYVAERGDGPGLAHGRFVDQGYASLKLGTAKVADRDGKYHDWNVIVAETDQHEVHLLHRATGQIHQLYDRYGDLKLRVGDEEVRLDRLTTRPELGLEGQRKAYSLSPEELAKPDNAPLRVWREREEERLEANRNYMEMMSYGRREIARQEEQRQKLAAIQTAPAKGTAPKASSTKTFERDVVVSATWKPISAATSTELAMRVNKELGAHIEADQVTTKGGFGLRTYRLKINASSEQEANAVANAWRKKANLRSW